MFESLHCRLSLTLITLLFCSSILIAQERTPEDRHEVFYFLGAWKDLPNQDSKSFLYIGFVNGFFAGDRSQEYDDLAKCIEKNISVDQALGMIDKYSKENPQRWNVPLPMGIAEALTVKDGPCPSLNPFK